MQCVVAAWTCIMVASIIEGRADRKESEAEVDLEQTKDHQETTHIIESSAK